MNYIILIGLAYLIYKLNDKNILNSKIKSSTVNKNTDYDTNSKISVVNYLKSELDEDYLKGNDTLKELKELHIIDVKKAFDKPNSKDTIIYHGGCLDCKSQSINGIGTCKGCKYFIPNWNLPSLKV